MHLGIADLASASGVTIDTIRFYQGKGLIAPPAKDGRNAVYGADHLTRLRQIRTLLGRGFSLAQIHRVSVSDDLPGDAGAREATDGGDALLRALAQQRGGEEKLGRDELAARAGVPVDLVNAAEAAGLIEPTGRGNDELFSSVDLEMLQTGLAVLGTGLPLSEFLELASVHDQNIREVSERGIDLFDDHVRKLSPNGDDPEVVAEAFGEVLPRLTRLVALHFQRTLVNRAMERLRAKGEGPALERALAAVEAAQLGGEWHP